ncbi:hypothetical protein AVEN_85696-1 [Araneus ventricosus]|uniref:Uncharacterized protein n=1 Tax=Araneus ventricosus TaxID=182803 RepID=A0A4Y2SSW9_ARAVE|nr:hypothetical protein AVEN_85696-1 [Araneus ventricosus]
MQQVQYTKHLQVESAFEQEPSVSEADSIPLHSPPKNVFLLDLGRSKMWRFIKFEFFLENFDDYYTFPLILREKIRKKKKVHNTLYQTKYYARKIIRRNPKSSLQSAYKFSSF